MNQDATFAPLKIKKRKLASLQASRYRVYKEDGGFVVVEAYTASEAFKNSGLASAKKIERESDTQKTLVDKEGLLVTEDYLETDANIPAPPVREGEEPAPLTIRIIPAPKEKGTEILRPDDVRFEAMSMAALSGKSSPAPAAPTPAASAPPPDASTAPVAEEAAPTPVAETVVAEAAPAAEQDKALSEEEVKKLLGDV